MSGLAATTSNQPAADAEALAAGGHHEQTEPVSANGHRLVIDIDYRINRINRFDQPSVRADLLKSR
jgi:hypothetical protein